MAKHYTVRALWDGEAEVWVAEGEDFPGLCTEAPTMEKLLKKLEAMVPEVLMANGLLRAHTSVPFELIGTMSAVASARA